MKVGSIGSNNHPSFKASVVANVQNHSGEFYTLMERLRDKYAKDSSFDRVEISAKEGKEIYTYAQPGDTVVSRDEKKGRYL